MDFELSGVFKTDKTNFFQFSTIDTGKNFYVFSNGFSYIFNDDGASFAKVEISLFAGYDIGNDIYVKCGHFTDNRKFVSSGRCIFSG